MYDNVAAFTTEEEAEVGAGAEAGAGEASAAGGGVTPAPAQAPQERHHRVAMKWFHEYHAKNYMLRDKAGKLIAATMYYDPVLDYNHALDAKMGLGVAWYTLPQSPELARAMYVTILTHPLLRGSFTREELPIIFLSVGSKLPLPIYADNRALHIC